MCSHPEIRTTCNIQVIDMGVSNYSIIMGRDWQAWTKGYYSMDGTNIIIPQGPKNIIVYREEIIVSYIENIPQPLVNHMEDDLDIYSIFTKEQIDVASSRIPLEDFQEIW